MAIVDFLWTLLEKGFVSPLFKEQVVQFCSSFLEEAYEITPIHEPISNQPADHGKYFNIEEFFMVWGKDHSPYLGHSFLT